MHQKLRYGVVAGVVIASAVALAHARGTSEVWSQVLILGVTASVGAWYAVATWHMAAETQQMAEKMMHAFCMLEPEGSLVCVYVKSASVGPAYNVQINWDQQAADLAFITEPWVGVAGVIPAGASVRVSTPHLAKHTFAHLRWQDIRGRSEYRRFHFDRSSKGQWLALAPPAG